MSLRTIAASLLVSPSLTSVPEWGLYSVVLMLTAATMGDQYLERTLTATQTKAAVNTTAPAEKTKARGTSPVATASIAMDPQRMGTKGKNERVVERLFTTPMSAFGLNEVSMTKIITTRRVSLNTKAPRRARPDTRELTLLT